MAGAACSWQEGEGGRLRTRRRVPSGASWTSTIVSRLTSSRFNASYSSAASPTSSRRLPPPSLPNLADLSDPSIAAAYEDVRSDKTETNWLLLDYAGEKSDKLDLTGSGSGGLEELKSHLADDRASFGYARISYANDKESQRAKFILIQYIGPSVRVMRKAKTSVHGADVKTVLRAFSIEVPASSLEDLEEEPIVARLRKAGGASYDQA